MATIVERTVNSGEKRFRVQIRRKGLPRFSLTFDKKEEALEWIRRHEMHYCEDPQFYLHWGKSYRIHARRMREVR